MKVIDIFCGAGGFSEGFRLAGFNVVWALDNWQVAVNTHSENHPNCLTIKGDVIAISTLPDKEFHNTVPDTEIIVGSPPCIAFSNSNKSGKGDKKLGVDLIKAFLRIVARKKFKKNSLLKYWLLENVPNSQFHIEDEYSLEELGLEGNCSLKVKHNNSSIYFAQDYGNPSKRQRYFCGEFITPTKIINDVSLITLKKIISDLKKPQEKLENIVRDPNYDFTMVAKEIADHHYINELADFEWKKAKRLKEDKGYMGKMSFPEDENKIARTIMATMSSSARESFILKHENKRYRLPTIREVASLMSFPIDYKFYGNSLQTKYRLVGNAVPPKLSFAFAKAIAVEEGIKVRATYKKILHKCASDFTNLNFDTFHIKTESPKKENARFKYHIPYLVVNAFRVELTNYRSQFKKKNYIWSVEIHRGQGPRAKIYLPKIDWSLISTSEQDVLLKKIKSYQKLLLSHKLFQKYFCKTSIERREKKFYGPEEFLDAVKIFLESLNIGPGQKITLINEKVEVPKVIYVGYLIMSSVMNKMGE